MAARKTSAARSARVAPRMGAAPAAMSDAGAGPSTWTMAAGIFAVLLVVYVANFRLLGAGDSIPTRLLPFSILREADLDLDEFSWERRPDGRLPYYVHQRGEHIYSVSTVATSVVVTPLYIVPAWWLAAAGVPYDDVRARVVIVAMERLCAATLAALSASLLFAVLRRLVTWRAALALTAIYALGTSTWSISSQALWPHALAQLTLVILCAVLMQPAPSRAALALAGLTAGVAVANRPQTAVFAGLALLFVWRTQRGRALAFAAAPLAIGALLVAYNTAIFSGVTGGYGGFSHFSAPTIEGVAGMLVSPNRGLFVFTPIMLFAVWGAARVWRVAAPPWLRWLTVGVGLYVLLHAAFKEWWAGYTYGPRYLTDVLPALTLFLAYGLVPLWRRPAVRVLAVGLALYGVAVQAIGVYCADDTWNRTPAPLELRPERVWDWSDLQIARAAHNGWRAGELMPVLFDAFTDPVPARLAPLRRSDLTAEIELRGLPDVMRPGATATTRVRITNRGTAAWPAFSGDGRISGRYLTFLLIRWMQKKQPVPETGDVLPLPENLAPGETLEMEVPITAPPRPGGFKLEVRMTQAVDAAHGIVGTRPLRRRVRVE